MKEENIGFSIYGNENSCCAELQNVFEGNKRAFRDFTAKFSDFIIFSGNNGLDFKDLEEEEFSSLYRKLRGISSFLYELISEFCIFEGLIVNYEDMIQISEKGKAFLMSDVSIQFADIMKYFWFHRKWGSSGEKFLAESGAKRFCSMLFMQAKDYFGYNPLKAFGITDKEIINKNFYYIAENFFSQNYVKTMIEDFFEPSGIMIKRHSGGYESTEFGTSVFKILSLNMEEEYINMLEECWECYDRGNFGQAFEMALDISMVLSKSSDPFLVMGCVYLKIKEYDKAKEIVRFAIHINETFVADVPSHKRYEMNTLIFSYFNLALCYFHLGENIEALKILYQLKKSLPYNIDCIEDVLLTIKQTVLIKGSDDDKGTVN